MRFQYAMDFNTFRITLRENQFKRKFSNFPVPKLLLKIIMRQNTRKLSLIKRFTLKKKKRNLQWLSILKTKNQMSQ